MAGQKFSNDLNSFKTTDIYNIYMKGFKPKIMTYYFIF